MPLETVNWIEDLVETNPVGATDPKSEGDDHIRNIKTALLANFPNLGPSPVKMTATQLSGFTGMIAAFAIPVIEGNASGWLRCNGQALLRADYPDLYALLGVIYGPGNTIDDFILPDYRGKFLRDQDQGAGVDVDAADRTDYADAVVGDVIGSEQDSANLSHTHPEAGDHTHPNAGSHSHTAPNGSSTAGDQNMYDALGGTDQNDNPRTNDSGDHGHPSAGVHTHGNEGESDSRPFNVYVQHYIHV